jgi:hypothetical protein
MIRDVMRSSALPSTQCSPRPAWRYSGSRRARPANAYAERWVRITRSECLNWIIVRSDRHLRHVLTAYP